MEAAEAVRLHERLVRRIARCLKARLPASVELDDLVQVGLMGLMAAAERFDGGAGVPFEAFAAQRIRGAMLDELRSADWSTRGERQHRRSADAAVCRLQHQLGRSPTEAEVAEALGLEPEVFRALSRQALGIQVIHFEDMDDAAADDDDAADCPGAAGDELANPMSRLINRRRHEAVYRAVQRLPERERRVIDLYYEQGKTFRENGEALGLSESGAFRVHREAIAHLRRQLAGW